jgi:hypothetical protein
MTILMKAGSYESQVSKDGKWEPETPKVVEVNGEKHLFTITRTAIAVEPLKSGDPGISGRPVVTAEEKIAQAESIARRAGQLSESLSKMLDEARREKDIMRANCVNRKRTEVNANTRNVEQRLKAMRDAKAGGDDVRFAHEYTVLIVLSQKLDQLDQEATQCLGQNVYEHGASQVVTTVGEYSNDPFDGIIIPGNQPGPPDPLGSPTRSLASIIITTADGNAKIAFEGVPDAPLGWLRK